MRILFISIFSILIIMLLFWTKPDTYAELRELPPPTVKTDLVSMTDIQPISRVTGKLQPARKADLHFQVSGQIEERLVEAGQFVEANSTLLAIEDGDYADVVEESMALLKQERNAIDRDSRLLKLMTQEKELQEQEVNRLERLGADSLSSKSNFDQALQELYRLQGEEARLKHSVDSARSRLMIEEAKLSKAERNLKRTKLVAPFNGTINVVHVEVGDYVSPGDSAVELVQVDQLDLNLEVTGTVASQLKLGQVVKIDTKNGKRDGEIIAIAVEPDAQTNTHALKIRLPSDNLYAGQLAVANLPGKFYEAVNVVPISAILYEDGQSFVFEMIDYHVEKKEVTLIERYNDLHIVDGVNTGSTIVSRDVSSLADGQIVSTQ